jgi:hypothetical protein
MGTSIRTSRKQAMLRELSDRVHLYCLLRDFRPSELITHFQENIGAADRAIGMSLQQDWDQLDRQLERGLITRGEYAREQWWAEVATCAKIAVQERPAASWMYWECI